MLWQVQQQEEEKYSELTQHSFISLINLQIKHRNISRIGFDPLNLFFKLITYYSKFFRTSKHHNAHNHSDIRYKQFILYKQMDNFFFFIGTCTYIFRVQISLYGKYNVVPKRSKNLRKQNPKTKRSQKNHNFQIKTQTQKIPNRYHSTRCSAVVTSAARCSPLPELLLSLAGRWTIVAGSLSLA